MRTDLTWFIIPAKRSWGGNRGRSLLLLVPHGCTDVVITKQVSEWLSANFVPPGDVGQLKPMVIQITADATSSTKHFVTRITRAVEGRLPEIHIDPSEYAADALEEALGAAHEHNIYPVLLIERFHAFARIGDQDLLSVLSKLRDLEHNAAVTTIAISPLGYDEVRRELDRAGQFPFVNSAYGDNHDSAVLAPISRAEFVAEAVRRGISEVAANSVYKIGGGPDVVFEALLDAVRDGEADRGLVDRAVQRLGHRLDNFLRFSLADLGQASSEILARLALGSNTPEEVQYLRAHALFQYLAKERGNDRLVTVTPILSRAILNQAYGPANEYGNCLASLRRGEYKAAVAMLAGKVPSERHLRTFHAIVRILTAIHGKNDPGLLGIDWDVVKRETNALMSEPSAWPKLRSWAESLHNWGTRVLKLRTGPNLALSDLALAAGDRDVLRVVIFSVRVYLEDCGAISAPGQQVRALSSMPESLLQTIASGFCGFTLRRQPSPLLQAEYDAFFPRGQYIFPATGSKLDLSALLVLVPAHLRKLYPDNSRVQEFCRPDKFVPLHGTLVEHVRNPSAHSYVEFKARDATACFALCWDILELLAFLSGAASSQEFMSSLGEPDADELGMLVSGVDPVP